MEDVRRKMEDRKVVNRRDRPPLPADELKCGDLLQRGKRRGIEAKRKKTEN